MVRKGSGGEGSGGSGGGGGDGAAIRRAGGVSISVVMEQLEDLRVLSGGHK